jgi:ubiquinone/menaquinone biosynthesis C-methylase UbiE
MTTQQEQANLSKYENPAIYDEQAQAYQSDLQYMKAYLLNQKAPIIELACGTGRLAIPLAKKGHEIYAVDIHSGMLEYAKQKAKEEQVNIHFYQQDALKLELPVKSNVIYMTGNSFQHFLTNESQDLLFEAVKRHLEIGGEFIFNTRNPVLHELAKVDVYEENIVLKGERVRIAHEEIYEPLTQVLHCTSTHYYPNHTFKDYINIRYTYPLELKRLLYSHGFELSILYGSWLKDPFNAKSVEMIVHAKRIR